MSKLSRYILLFIILVSFSTAYAQSNKKNLNETVFVKLADKIIPELNKLGFPSKILLLSVNTQKTAGCGMDTNDYSQANEATSLLYKSFWTKVNFNKFVKNFSDKVIIPVQDITGVGFEQIEYDSLEKYIDFGNIPRKKLDNMYVFSYSNIFGKKLKPETENGFFVSDRDNDKLSIRLESKKNYFKVFLIFRTKDYTPNMSFGNLELFYKFENNNAQEVTGNEYDSIR